MCAGNHSVNFNFICFITRKYNFSDYCNIQKVSIIKLLTQLKMDLREVQLLSLFDRDPVENSEV